MRNNGRELSQTEVGKLLGVSKSRVAQIEERAIRKLWKIREDKKLMSLALELVDADRELCTPKRKSQAKRKNRRRK